MKALILAGGSGTRLWPLSRKNYPKQFLKLKDDCSLLQQTVERLLNTVSIKDIILVTNGDYKFHVLADMDRSNFKNSQSGCPHIILEPAGRNTAPAIALGVKYCMEKLGCKKNEVILVAPSDHIMKPNDKFAGYIRLAEKIAGKGYIVTFGIKPDEPETGYGYIEKGDALKIAEKGINAYKVKRFAEKPDRATARRYIRDGNYYWNSGMFAFTIGTIIEEFRKHAPQIKKMLAGRFDEIVSNFKRMPDISIDYAVAEKSDKVATVPLDLCWNDIGSWDAILKGFQKDSSGNVKIGDVIDIDTKDTLVIGNKRLIATVGLEDILVIETDDAILIAKKGDSQKVKNVVDILKSKNRIEAFEHKTVYRPWGEYTVLEEGNRYKIKRIVVRPEGKLSLQMHHHRSEHWIVVKGTAKVTIDGKEIFIHENESAYVPKSTLHRLENPGKVSVELIEVQNGEYVEENDIKRFKDEYSRHKFD